MSIYLSPSVPSFTCPTLAVKRYRAMAARKGRSVIAWRCVSVRLAIAANRAEQLGRPEALVADLRTLSVEANAQAHYARYQEAA